jgi:hypothetical protein
MQEFSAESANVGIRTIRIDAHGAVGNGNDALAQLRELFRSLRQRSDGRSRRSILWIDNYEAIAAFEALFLYELLELPASSMGLLCITSRSRPSLQFTADPAWQSVTRSLKLGWLRGCRLSASLWCARTLHTTDHGADARPCSGAGPYRARRRYVVAPSGSTRSSARSRR